MGADSARHNPVDVGGRGGQRLKPAAPNLTAHSLKVGATQVLEWAVAEGKLSLELKTRLLKHDPRDASLEMSLRYGIFDCLCFLYFLVASQATLRSCGKRLS